MPVFYYLRIVAGQVTALSRLGGLIDVPDWYLVSEAVFLDTEARVNNGDYTAPDLSGEGA